MATIRVSTVHLQNGDVREANDIRVNQDSVLWTDLGITTGVPIDSIEYLEGNSGLYGGVDGLGIGMLVGGALGSAIFALDHEPDDLEWYYATIGYGAIGGVVGFVAGVIIGHHYRYEFAREQ